MENKDMTFEEFVTNLPLLDWYYNMSDDGRAYERGRLQVQRYRELAESNGSEWMEAFKAEQKKWKL